MRSKLSELRYLFDEEDEDLGYELMGDIDELAEDEEEEETDKVPKITLRRFNQNPDKTFNCLVRGCESIFRTRRERKCHITLIHGSRIHCPYANCNAFFNTSTFYHHVKHVHEKLRRPCPNCRKPILAYYMGEHRARCLSDGQKSHKCKVGDCNKAFYNVYDLRHHTRTVHRTPIKCPIEGCNVVMKPKSVRNHLKFMHVERAGTEKKNCPKCKKMYLPNSFAQHYKRCMSDGQKKYRCPVEGCESTFLTDYYRNNHVYVVHRSMVSCPFENCLSRVKSSYLAQHIKRRHPRIGRLKFQKEFLRFIAGEMNVNLVDCHRDEMIKPGEVTKSRQNVDVNENLNEDLNGDLSESLNNEFNDELHGDVSNDLNITLNAGREDELMPNDMMITTPMVIEVADPMTDASLVTLTSLTSSSESDHTDELENSRDAEVLEEVEDDWSTAVFEEVEEEFVYDFMAF